MTVMNTMMKAGNKVGVALYQRTNGRVGGKAKGGIPVLLLTVNGRKTGMPHTTPVGYFEYDDKYLVVGSAGGMKQHPQWIRNLEATDTAQVQIGGRTFSAGVRAVAGEERDALFRDVVLARHPYFANYEEKSGRTLKLALLTPSRK